ncbi:transcriptional regulator [Candidatus Bathyarchaeota archaeon]|nr:MAG: transcriptional regulator [Candidatus Bathyarchaeota archaeon]
MHRGANLEFKAGILKALGDPIRLEILELLRDEEKCVCEIASHLGTLQPLISRHLTILKRYGLVKYRKDGNRRYYSITDPRVFQIIDLIDDDLLNSLSKRIIEQIV